jgi:hypothetical protein
VSRVTRLIAIVSWAVLTRSALGQDSTKVRTAVVTYVTSASVYIDAGREEGLREGAPVQVFRRGAVIATLKVSFLSSHQGSCEIMSQTMRVVVGDSARFTPAPPDVDATIAASRPSARRPAGSRSTLRGRIGAHYLVVGAEGGGGFTQPSFDLWLDGRPNAGGPFALAIDIRARRTASSLPAGTVIDDQTRAYQLALAWSPPTSPTRVTLGRQIALGLASVGLYDGVSAELHTRRWNGGLFMGTQPNPLTLDFATDVVEAGGYVQRHGSGQNGRLWSATVGVSGSYQNAHANREFALLQGSYSTRRVAVFASQEIDYYRAWKRTTGTPAVSLTSTFATVRYRASDGIDLQAGFDNRRNVLLYRDVINPVTTFDDAFRQGVWAGMYLRFARRYVVGLDARRSSGGVAGTADAVTATFGADRVAGTIVGLRARTTYYHSPALDGWLQSASLAAYPGVMHIELSGGLRNERERFALATSTTSWIAGDLDVSLARAWYLMVSGTVESGPERTSQLYGGFNVRF